MKKLLLTLLLFSGVLGYSQINITSGGSHSTCSDTFVDSGGTGGAYVDSEDYTITFCSTVPGQAVKIDFTAFDTEGGIDELTIYDGNSIAAPILAVYSGTTLPAAVTGTTSNATDCLTVRFTSDTSITGAGWEATISCAAPVTGPITMQNGSTSVCSGTFTDAGGFGNYTANENYTYTICPSTPGQAIELDFSDISIDSTDSMIIYDGNSTGAPVLTTFSGVWGMSGVTIAGTTANATGCLTISFVSDGTWESAGWNATISCVAPVVPPHLMQNTTITTCTGQFADSGYLGNYSANEDYIMTFCSDTAGQTTQLDFTSFDLQGADYMVIYDGNSVTEDILGVYNNTSPGTIAGTINNTSDCLTVRFVSNATTQYAGWLADISCVTPVTPAACQGNRSEEHTSELQSRL